MKTLKISFLVIMAIGVIAITTYVHVPDTFGETKDSMSSMMGMCSMMNKTPKDVTIKTIGSQIVTVGKEAKITLSIIDKNNKEPIISAQVPIMIERGPSMSSMDMATPMFGAEEIGSGKYLVKFTPDKKGIYTIHIHVIPEGKSMMAMMNNHMDIGIIAK